MNARSNRRHVSNAGMQSVGKPVAVCTEESWLDLLRPERERLADLEAAQNGELSIDDETDGLLLALGEAVEQRDHNLAGHCERLAWIAVAMGVVMRLERTSLLALYRGGYLHDVGKVGIPDSILFNPRPLSAATRRGANRFAATCTPSARCCPSSGVTTSVSTAPGIRTGCGARRFRCWLA